MFLKRYLTIRTIYLMKTSAEVVSRVSILAILSTRWARVLANNNRAEL